MTKIIIQRKLSARLRSVWQQFDFSRWLFLIWSSLIPVREMKITNPGWRVEAHKFFEWELIKKWQFWIHRTNFSEIFFKNCNLEKFYKFLEHHFMISTLEHHFMISILEHHFMISHFEFYFKLIYVYQKITLQEIFQYRISMNNYDT